MDLLFYDSSNGDKDIWIATSIVLYEQQQKECNSQIQRDDIGTSSAQS
jgi:hypothetical protein